MNLSFSPLLMMVAGSIVAVNVKSGILSPSSLKQCWIRLNSDDKKHHHRCRNMSWMRRIARRI